MPFVTFEAARSRASIGGAPSEEAASSFLRESVERARDSDRWDIFLSHASKDAKVVYGVYLALLDSGYSVYVDWLHDKQLDREKVTANTANVLRIRMRQSKSLIFLVTESAPNSKWMPWELGYFDGYKPLHVAILPVTQSSQHFQGQEYLLLYPWVTIDSAGVMKNWSIGQPNFVSGTKSFNSFVVS